MQEALAQSLHHTDSISKNDQKMTKKMTRGELGMEALAGILSCRETEEKGFPPEASLGNCPGLLAVAGMKTMVKSKLGGLTRPNYSPRLKPWLNKKG